MVILHKRRNNNTNAADLHIVDKGIPCFPYPNSPFKNGQKHSTNHTQHKTSPSPEPSPSWDGGCRFNKLTTSAVKCTIKMVVPSTKIGDSSKVNLPASTSWAPLLEVDLSFFVTSKTVSDILKSLRMTLRNPNNHAVIVVILSILWLFHQARTERPALRYSDRV